MSDTILHQEEEEEEEELVVVQISLYIASPFSVSSGDNYNVLFL